MQELTQEGKHKEVIRILDECVLIKSDTVTIIIYSKVVDIVNVSINTVKYKIRPGLNKICLCGLYRRTLSLKLKLVSTYLSEIEEVKSIQKEKQFFVLKGKGHERKCINNRIPKLISLSYFSMIVGGYSERKLYQDTKKGNIPKEIYNQRLPWCNHLARFGFTDIFNVWIPLTTTKVSACKYPSEHLNIQTV
jgi:hypothetical protein